MPSLEDRLSIDSGVPIAYLLGEETGEFARTQIFQPGRILYFNRLGLAEVFYILCRRKGMNFAKENITTFLRTNYCTFEDSHELAIEAASYKCERAVSLPDCYVIALAKLTRSTAVFARKEKEIIAEMDKRKFDIPMVFLEDLV